MNEEHGSKKSKKPIDLKNNDDFDDENDDDNKQKTEILKQSFIKKLAKSESVAMSESDRDDDLESKKANSIKPSKQPKTLFISKSNDNGRKRHNSSDLFDSEESSNSKSSATVKTKIDKLNREIEKKVTQSDTKNNTKQVSKKPRLESEVALSETPKHQKVSTSSMDVTEDDESNKKRATQVIKSSSHEDASIKQKSELSSSSSSSIVDSKKPKDTIVRKFGDEIKVKPSDKQVNVANKPKQPQSERQTDKHASVSTTPAKKPLNDESKKVKLVSGSVTKTEKEISKDKSTIKSTSKPVTSSDNKSAKSSISSNSKRPNETNKSSLNTKPDEKLESKQSSKQQNSEKSSTSKKSEKQNVVKTTEAASSTKGNTTATIASDKKAKQTNESKNVNNKECSEFEKQTSTKQSSNKVSKTSKGEKQRHSDMVHDSTAHADEEMLTLGTIIKSESILFKSRIASFSSNNNVIIQENNIINQQTDNEDTSEYSVDNSFIKEAFIKEDKEECEKSNKRSSVESKASIRLSVDTNAAVTIKDEDLPVASEIVVNALEDVKPEIDDNEDEKSMNNLVSTIIEDSVASVDTQIVASSETKEIEMKEIDVSEIETNEKTLESCSKVGASDDFVNQDELLSAVDSLVKLNESSMNVDDEEEDEEEEIVNEIKKIDDDQQQIDAISNSDKQDIQIAVESIQKSASEDSIGMLNPLLSTVAAAAISVKTPRSSTSSSRKSRSSRKQSTNDSDCELHLQAEPPHQPIETPIEQQPAMPIERQPSLLPISIELAGFGLEVLHKLTSQESVVCSPIMSHVDDIIDQVSKGNSFYFFLNFFFNLLFFSR